MALDRTDEPAEQESLRLHSSCSAPTTRHRGGDLRSLAARGVSIEELSTDVREAPMAGGTLFEARAVLNAPPTTSTETLRSMLEGLADELMVEISLSED